MIKIRINESIVWVCVLTYITLVPYCHAHPDPLASSPQISSNQKNSVSPDTPRTLPIKLKVLVLNYDPFFGGKRLHEVLGFNDPRLLAKNYLADMKQSTQGLVEFEIVEWRDLDEIYAREDGGIYQVDDYVHMRKTNTGWPKNIVANYPRILEEQKVVPKIDDGTIDEVWIFGDHYFGLWEASMAGPGAFFINGGVYPNVASVRPFAFYGFNYERGVAEMLHNTAHRVEATMNRTYGPWNLKTPQNNWELFSANADQSQGIAGVGTCHWPANAQSDYDYVNSREVLSYAEDFRNYPNLTFQRKSVSSKTWSSDGIDPHRGYMKWYFALIPKASGINKDGRLNNWLPYIFDFQNYDNTGKPLSNRCLVVKNQLKSNTFSIMLGFSTAAGIDITTVKTDSILLKTDGQSIKPMRVHYPREDFGTYRTVSYVFSNVDAATLESSVLTLLPQGAKALDNSEFDTMSWRIVKNGSEWTTIPINDLRDSPKAIASWILESGGKIGLDSEVVWIEDAKQLQEMKESAVERIQFWNDQSKSPKPFLWSDTLSFKAFPKISSLELRGQPVGDRGCEALSALTHLRNLNLHACGITDAGVKTIANLKKLERLDIGYSQGRITDAGAKELRRLTSLKWLNIYNSSITDKTLLTVLAELPNLEYVEITSTPTTSAGVAKLRELRPKLMVVHHDLDPR